MLLQVKGQRMIQTERTSSKFKGLTYPRLSKIRLLGGVDSGVHFFSVRLPETAWHNHHLVFTTPQDAFPRLRFGREGRVQKIGKIILSHSVVILSLPSPSGLPPSTNLPQFHRAPHYVLLTRTLLYGHIFYSTQNCLKPTLALTLEYTFCLVVYLVPWGGIHQS